MGPRHFVSTIAKFNESKKLACTTLLSESGQTLTGVPIDIKVLTIVLKYTDKVYDNEPVFLCSNKVPPFQFEQLVAKAKFNIINF